MIKHSRTIYLVVTFSTSLFCIGVSTFSLGERGYKSFSTTTRSRWKVEPKTLIKAEGVITRLYAYH